MSRSVSAPSSVTKTSPCWKGFMVPGSTFRYGSSFCSETRKPRATSRLPRLDAVRPLPSEEATPPVTKRCFVRLTRGPTGLQPIASEGSTTNNPPSSPPRANHQTSNRARQLPIHRDKFLDNLVLIGPVGSPGQARRPQRRSPAWALGKLEQLSDCLFGVTSVEQGGRIPNELLDTAHPGADQGHPSKQRLLSNQRAGFPG